MTRAGKYICPNSCIYQKNTFFPHLFIICMYFKRWVHTSILFLIQYQRVDSNFTPFFVTSSMFCDTQFCGFWPSCIYYHISMQSHHPSSLVCHPFIDNFATSWVTKYQILVLLVYFLIFYLFIYFFFLVFFFFLVYFFNCRHSKGYAVDPSFW